MENVAQQNDMVVDDEAVLPYPPRYWWLKRISIASGIFILLLIILRLWWGYEANRRLQVEIDKYRAAGQLVYAHEFDAELDAVEDSENAAVLLEQAAEQIVYTSSSGVNYEDFMDDPTLFETDPVSATELMQKNTNVFDLVKQARERPMVAWSPRLQSMFTNPIFIGSNQRSLAKLLYFTSNYYFTVGDHANAFSALEDFHFLSESIEEHPTIISQLVAWACHGLNLQLIENHLANLAIDDVRHNINIGTNTVSRDRITKLISMLLNEKHGRKMLFQSFQGERALTFHLLSPISNIGGSLKPQLFPPPMTRPDETNILTSFLYVIEILRMLEFNSLATEATQKENCPDAKLCLSKINDSPTIALLWSRYFFQLDIESLYKSTPRIIELYYRLLARRRMAAVALAIRLYEIDHDHRPAQLSELIPMYLDEIPLDPFSSVGGAIRYKLNFEYPLLYSVGSNETDDGGKVIFDDDKKVINYRIDILFFLDGPPKSNPTVNSSQTSDTNKYIHNENRQNN